MATVDHKIYLLQKYLRPRADRKRSKKHARGSGLKIIDDDLDTSKLQPLDDDALEALAGDEDAPQIAGLIDDRPDDVKKMEQFQTSSKWKVVTQDDGFDSKIQIEEIKKSITKTAEDSNPMFGKMYSDSEDEKKNESDLSPPRKPHKTTGEPDTSKNKVTHQNSDSDLSPPRHKSRKKSFNQSPVRNSTKTEHSMSKKGDRRQSPARRRKSPERKRQNTSDSDLSPPRYCENKGTEKERKPSRWGHFGPEESNKTQRDTSRNPDSSPPRKSSRGDNFETRQEKQKGDKASDSDLSPPRKSRKDQISKNTACIKSSKHAFNRNKPNSDLSPPRKSKRRDRSVDSDLSPPRKARNDSPGHSRPKRAPERVLSNRVDDRHSSSQFRNEPRDPAKKDERAKYNDRRRNSCSPPPSNKKMAKTLEGKQAGLQDAKQMRSENEEFRRREEELYSKMSADASGQHATTVSRRLGKRETSADREKNREQQARKKEMEEKYSKWGKGLKQVADQEARVADYLVEASKPLARHRDDAALEATLRRVEREGDPMRQYMRERESDVARAPERPVYQGDWPPNRFNIRPGHRWDGVDRSSGYERKLFDSRSQAKALAEEAYKWSTEDL